MTTTITKAMTTTNTSQQHEHQRRRKTKKRKHEDPKLSGNGSDQEASSNYFGYLFPVSPFFVFWVRWGQAAHDPKKPTKIKTKITRILIYYGAVESKRCSAEAKLSEHSWCL